MRILLAVVAPVCVFIFGLASCEDRFRYACQNPENWETKECQKPYCEVSQTCPEHVYAYQRGLSDRFEKGGQSVAPPAERKGEQCECPK